MKANIGNITFFLCVGFIVFALIYHAVHDTPSTSPRATIISIRKCEYILFNNTLTHCGDCTNHVAQ